VAAHELAARDDHDVAGLEQPEREADPAEIRGDRRLARARRAEQQQVERPAAGLEALLLALGLDAEEVGLLADLALDLL
jgi:hypothetical protein